MFYVIGFGLSVHKKEMPKVLHETYSFAQKIIKDSGQLITSYSS